MMVDTLQAKIQPEAPYRRKAKKTTGVYSQTKNIIARSVKNRNYGCFILMWKSNTRIQTTAV